MKRRVIATMAITSAMAFAASDNIALNTGLWFNGTQYSVETGLNCIDIDGTECHGYWFDFDDRANDHGGSYILYPYFDEDNNSALIATIDNLGYLAVEYHLVDPTTTGQTAAYPYNFAGLGFKIVYDYNESADITELGGLCVTYTADHNVLLQVEDPKTASSDALCNVPLRATTAPTTVSKDFSEFKQPTWTATKDKLSSCNEAFSKATAFKFRVEGDATERDGRLRIFEVGPKGTCQGGKHASTSEPDKFRFDLNKNHSSSSSTPNSSSSSVARSVNTGIWFNGSDYQVNTGADDMYEYGVHDNSTMGIWYDFDDRANDHGGSYALYPYRAEGDPASYIYPEIDNLGYVTIKYHLEDPTLTGQEEEYLYNFVGLAFNIVNTERTPFDITDAQGLCATYTSDINVNLEVVDPYSTDKNACYITLPKSSKVNTVSKSISDFKQPTWTPTANKLNSCAQAFAKAQTIRFKLDGGASAGDGQLRIFEVGPNGTCKGGKDISKSEPSVFAHKSEGTNMPVEPGDDIDYKKKCQTFTKDDSTYFYCNNIKVFAVYNPSEKNESAQCSLKKKKGNYNVICNGTNVGTIKNNSTASVLTCTESDSTFTCTIEDESEDKVARKSAPSMLSIYVKGRKVTLDGFGDNVYYRLFDMQGNTVDSGYTNGNIDLSDVKSGSYLLKVKGSFDMTKKITLN